MICSRVLGMTLAWLTGLFAAICLCAYDVSLLLQQKGLELHFLIPQNMKRSSGFTVVAPC